jgi:diaminohydroxyphosphoribosylaminopyrimidine deaminase/5-amino-6-(5-phosphoribosylamino)uracil reductase
VTEPTEPEADRRWLLEAISLSRRCPPSQTAYSVGAVLVAADGSVLSTGYSRETGPGDHAEEVALAKISLPTASHAAGAGAAPGAGAGAGAGAGGELAAATLYSSLEPCAVRASRPVPCADLIIASGVGRVVIAWTEPPLLAPGGGAGRLRAAGVAVIEVPELAAAARAVNAHLLVRGGDDSPGNPGSDWPGDPPTPVRRQGANGPPGRD